MLEEKEKVPFSVRPQLFNLFAIAAFFGLGAGFLEASVFSIIRLVPGWMTWMMLLDNATAEIFWVAPVFYLIFYITLASFLMLVFAFKRLPRLPRLVTIETIAVLFFSWLTFYAVFGVTGRMSRWACCILALGLAVQICRSFQSRQQIMIAWFRRGLASLLLALALAIGATTGMHRYREASLVRELPPSPPGATNVLLIVLDTLRADHLSSYGYQRLTTPNIDRFAQEGVIFENAFAQASWTVPSHASLMTGRPVFQHNADSHRPTLGKEYLTLAELMASQGYATAGVSANTWWVTRNVGLDRGFLHFEDYFWSVSDMVTRPRLGKEIRDNILPNLGYRDNLNRRRAEDINQAFLEWIDANSNAPFFVFLNYIDVHAPYLAPTPFHTKFMNEDEAALEKSYSLRPPMVGSATTPKSRILEAAYDGCLASLDSNLGDLLSELQLRGLLDTTLVIITSDHGESFGEHGMFQHGGGLYLDQLHVPLVFRLPGKIPSGMRVYEPVGLYEIPATVTGLTFPDMAPVFPGSSLSAFWTPLSSKANSDTVPVLSEIFPRGGLPEAWPLSKGWIKSLITSQWHFILQENGQVELYKIGKDPEESENLSDTSVGRGVVADFKLQMQAMLSAQDRTMRTRQFIKRLQPSLP